MVTVLINPVSGGARPHHARQRAVLAAAAVEARGLEGEIFVTGRRGQARELAASALRRGTTRVVAWGGDGTVNEVASAIAFSDVAMGIVPAGSGNGLAGELGLPSDPARALDIALDGRPRPIDVGEMNGRYFVNVAGVGFDADVARRFDAAPNRRRGFLSYVWLTAQSLLQYTPARYTVTAGEWRRSVRALLVVVANGTEFGNRMRIAPGARVDDGTLDVVVVEEHSRVQTIGQLPLLALGRVNRSAVWSSHHAEVTDIESDAPMWFHVDGEPVSGGTSLRARVHPGALQVCASP
jgi:YegS/Rv2252/BmrU family lipid kinase